MKFHFENLDVYQRSQHLFEKIGKTLSQKRGEIPYFLADQLARSSLSIPINIAEGNGRWHQNDKKQFFYIARGSIFESVALIEALKNQGLLDGQKVIEFRQDLIILAKMLTALIHSLETPK